MAARLGYGLAVPSDGLLAQGKNTELVLAGKLWTQLDAYLDIASTLPSNMAVLGEEARGAVEDLRSAALAFGSAQRLRETVAETPDLLAAVDPPTQAFAAVLWLVQKLNELATQAESSISVIDQDGPSVGEDRIGPALRALSKEAYSAGAPAGRILDGFRSGARRLQAANAALVERFGQEAARLHSIQQAVGAARYDVGHFEDKIAKLGLLSPKSKRQNLEEQLATARRVYRETAKEEERLRASVAELEAVETRGHWFEMAVESIDEFLRTLRQSLMDYGRALAQLSVDMTPEQRGNRVWIEHELDPKRAIDRWREIGRASGEFIRQSMMDR